MAVIDDAVAVDVEPDGSRRVGLSRLALAIGVIGSVAVTARAGVGSAVTLGALAGGLAVVVRDRTGLLRLTAAAALLLPFLVIRDNSWLALCILFTSGLVGAFVALAAGTDQRPFDFRVGAVLRLEPQSTGARPAVPFEGNAGVAIAVVRGGVLAIVITALFRELLAASDSVFASLVDFGIVPVGRLGFGGVLATTFLVVALIASMDRVTRPVAPRRPLGMVECTMVLGALNLLFLAFVVLRLGNVGKPLSEEAWRSEVRSGFFQLLFVAALAIALLLLLRRIVRTDTAAHRSRFRWLAIGTVVLAGLIDVIALQRIAEYVQRNFMTPLRWWSFGFGLFLMAVLALVAVRILGWRAAREWVSGAVICTWMVFVAVMALSNPDQRMADYNFDHPRESDGVISVQALFWLSEDATPTIVERIDALRPLPNTRFDRMVDHLCATTPQESWRQFNFARSDASEATKELCAP